MGLELNHSDILPDFKKKILRDKFKAKFFDVNCSSSHIKYYNFY